MIVLVIFVVLGIAALLIFWLPEAREYERWCREQYGMPCSEVAELVDSVLYDGTEKSVAMETIRSVSPDSLELTYAIPGGLDEDEISECYVVSFNEDKGLARFWRTFCFDNKDQIVYAIEDFRTDFALVHPPPAVPLR